MVVVNVLSGPRKCSAALVEINFKTEAGIRSEFEELSAITFPSAGLITNKPGEARDFALMYLSSECSEWAGVLETTNVSAAMIAMKLLRTSEEY